MGHFADALVIRSQSDFKVSIFAKRRKLTWISIKYNSLEYIVLDKTFSKLKMIFMIKRKIF